MFKVLVIISCLFLNSCLMVGPDYKEPQKDVAAHWLDKDSTINESSFRNANWWAVFNDPTLTALILEGYQNNLSIQSAAVRVLQARAQLAQSVGELYPQKQYLKGHLDYMRTGGGSLAGIWPSNFDVASLGATGSWEIDFWGKYRRAVLANDAAFLASFSAYDNALVTLTSDIATDYINIRTTEELIKITKENIKLQESSLAIAQARHKAGQTSLQDVEEALTELSQTEATLPQYISQLRHDKDTLAVLLGLTPDAIDTRLGKSKGIPGVPKSVAVGIPQETIAQRPDIHQARLDAIAQLEGIGSVKANLYPALSLNGTFDFSATTIGRSSLNQLFNWSNRSAITGPSFVWPILNYGQITNAVREQDAAYQEATLNYLNLVLQAQQEVQDDITQFIETKKSKKYLLSANQSAIQSTKLAIIRYREGETDYTPVLDAERQQLQVQTSLTNVTGDVPKSLVALYRALGGGWQVRGCDDIVTESLKQQMAKRTNWGNLLKKENHFPPNSQREQIKERYLPSW